MKCSKIKVFNHQILIKKTYVGKFITAKKDVEKSAGSCWLDFEEDDNLEVVSSFFIDTVIYLLICF